MFDAQPSQEDLADAPFGAGVAVGVVVMVQPLKRVASAKNSGSCVARTSVAVSSAVNSISGIDSWCMLGPDLERESGHGRSAHDTFYLGLAVVGEQSPPATRSAGAGKPKVPFCND
ncbi:hypothetical protein AB0F91_37250 [Amycolatopsis sp. NPDC023774]|uniref:hypothetical protein n=1 Tax=Amycolatopsis sp. NPDC023774 TaxID=3155015 RepID=UPI0033EBDE20